MRAGTPRKGQERVSPQQISAKYAHAVFFDGSTLAQLEETQEMNVRGHGGSGDVRESH